VKTNQVKTGIKAQKTDVDTFLSMLKEYKRVIDDDIAGYSKAVEKTTLQNYGSYSRVAADVFLDILSRGGKRIRGALVCLGYEMSGGKDLAMIVQAARAIEMIHAYFLIMDDIQDRSDTRRGAPAAHILLADYHRKHHLAGDAEHFGIALAMNAMGIGNHAAQMLLANLNAPEDLRIKSLSILNRTAIITAHGQTNDIMNQVVAQVSEDDVERVMEWKTAHYSFLNPLHVGMVLAGAECGDTTAITEYSMHTGKAFQITDDILGTFGTEFESGKSPMDDMCEGKRTLLSTYALEHTTDSDKNFLLQMLGNRHLTPAEFERCKDIISQSGGLEHAQQKAEEHARAALESLAAEKDRWSNEGVSFLSGLAQYLLTRRG